MAVIAFESMTRRYGSRRGVESLTFQIEQGTIFGFLGPNGAGKTTAIRVLVGLLPPTSGHVRVFGMDAWQKSFQIKRSMGYLPGDLKLYPWMTGRTALTVAGRMRGVDLMGSGKELARLLELDLRVKVRRMSRGMKQKLGLILALAHRPPLLVLDEPSTGLDPLMQAKLRNHLRGLAAEGNTVFFSSHTLGEVEELCDRIAMIRDGRLVTNEPLDQLRSATGYEITVRWRCPSDADQVTPPAFLECVERAPGVWRALARCPVDHLIRWLADQSLEDVSIHHPDLETVFQQYYRGNPPNSASCDTTSP